MSDKWEIIDSRSGQRVGIMVYPSKKYAEGLIDSWKARDKRGGRPDIRHLMPFLEAQKVERDE